MRVCVGVILVVCLPVLAFAQSISNYSGEFVHNGSLTINGFGFGSKSDVSPVVWDDMESGDFSPDWGSTRQLFIGTESRSENSAFCGTHNFQGSGGDGQHGYFSGPNSPVARRWFCQYWFKLDENWNWGGGTYGSGDENLANIKIFRMWNPSSIDENFSVATVPGSNVIAYDAEYISPGQYSLFWGGFKGDWTVGTWHCLQFEFADSDQGVNNGVFRVWGDGQLVVEDTTLETREDFAAFKRPLILGFYNSWGDGGTDRDDFYIDDAYIDNSWARVEIGNSPDYNSCTHREIQIPTAWSDGAVTVKANAGSFSPGEDLYIFVTNEDGSVSSGYPLASRGGGDVTPPQISGIELEYGAGDFDIRVTCVTNEEATAVLSYGLDTGYGSSATGSTSDGLEHLFVLSGLIADAVYYYRIEATDSLDNTGVTSGLEFRNFNIAPPQRVP